MRPCQEMGIGCFQMWNYHGKKILTHMQQDSFDGFQFPKRVSNYLRCMTKVGFFVVVFSLLCDSRFIYPWISPETLKLSSSVITVLSQTSISKDLEMKIMHHHRNKTRNILQEGSCLAVYQIISTPANPYESNRIAKCRHTK